ncbi:hypothetical protein T10_6551 [Trichinella papuae]|uniref:Uncharacterized protein n=1 Tax=Trichinella papuae TaxID=268474 RepID=A0A0V1MF85_9BILA|nr:hypothetical protein T10_6551 [Trichinella papuae]
MRMLDEVRPGHHLPITVFFASFIPASCGQTVIFDLSCLSSLTRRSMAAMATRHMVRRDAGAKRSSLTASGEIIFRNLIILIINQNFLMTQQFAKRHRPNYTFTNDSAPQHSQAGDSRFPFYPIT